MNFLVLAIDCLRADRLPNRGHVKTTPTLHGLASRGLACTQAITASVTTTPSFSSLLTGRFPPTHGVFSLRGYSLSPGCPTLVEAFAQGGYHTFAEVTGPLLECVGLNRGFQSYRCRNQKEYLTSPWGEELLEILRTRSHPQPWFGLVHLWELHAPRYVPVEFNDARFGATPYDRALAALDRSLSRLLEVVPRDTTIVVMGDHGESLSRVPAAGLGTRFVRGLSRRVGLAKRPRSRYQLYRRQYNGHGWHLFDELVRVPLVFFGDGVQAKELTQQVRTVDVLSTLLDLAGLPLPDDGPPIHGRSILPLVDGAEEDNRPAYMEAAGSCLPDQSFWLRGLRSGRFKYLYTPFSQEPVEELYDLERDPGETRNIVTRRPEEAAQLRAQCEAFASVAQDNHQSQAAMSAEEEAVLTERLKQLGYL